MKATRLNEPDVGVGERITSAWMIVCEHGGPDDEGLPAMLMGNKWVPLIVCTEQGVKFLRERAREISRTTGKKFKLIRMSVREDIETISWGN